MSLVDKINQDLKEAMRSKDTLKLDSLRMLKSALMNAKINSKADTLSDAEILSVISKQLKQRQDSAEAYRKGDRKELAEKEEAEIKIYQDYLPAQISDEELGKKIQEIISQNGFQSKKEFGKAMRLAQESFKGQADNKRISTVLNKILK